MICGRLGGGGAGGRMDTSIGRAKSLCCAPKTIPRLLVGYTLI